MSDMLHVFIDNEIVGAIYPAADRSFSFAYVQSWVDALDRFPLSTRLPLTTEIYSPDVAVPYFQNLLPEGEQPVVLGRKFGISASDVLGLLQHLGGDMPGALRIADVQEPAADPRATYRALDEAQIAADLAALPDRPLLVDDDGAVRVSLAGVQDKFTVAVVRGSLALPVYGAASTHIVKPPIPRLDGSAHNEWFCMSLARRCGLIAADAELRHAQGNPYLLIRRYDRMIVGNKVRRLHQEDFCQALGMLSRQKYQASGGPTFADLFQVLNRQSSQLANDRLQLVDYAIFNLLVGNTDAHGKNFSLLIDSTGVRLAPLYDVMCADVYPSVTRNMAMSIGDDRGRRRAEHVYAAHWREFARSAGVAERHVLTRVAELADLVTAQAATLAAEAKADLQHPILPEIRESIARIARHAKANLAYEDAGVARASSAAKPTPRRRRS